MAAKGIRILYIDYRCLLGNLMYYKLYCIQIPALYVQFSFKVKLSYIRRYALCTAILETGTLT